MSDTRNRMLSRRGFLTKGAVGTFAATLDFRFSPTLALDEELHAASNSSPNAAPSDADVGNLFQGIQSYSATLDQSYSFLRPRWQDLEVWKNAARKRIWDKLAYRPAEVPLNPEIVSREGKEDYFQEKVVFSSAAHTRIPAYLLIPKRRKLPAPAVVALHDHGGFYYWGKEKLVEHEAEHPKMIDFRKLCYGGVAYASELARAGFVVLIIDAFYFGERRLEVAQLQGGKLAGLAPDSGEYIDATNSMAGRSEVLVAKTIFLSGATWPGMMFWDDIKSVDYLTSRPEVDPRRIGCVGLSIGGYRAAHLCALEPRIRAAVVVGWMCTYGSMLRNHLEHHTWMIYVPGLYQYMDLPDIVSLTAPGALLVQYCNQDSLFPVSGMEASAEKIKRLYVKAKIPKRFKASFFDAPHQFNKAMQAEAFEWLRKAL